ncbi:hypothetical protein CA54_58560 [Symmachiella macrocystis]|uniref:Uncharacterized protein n=1 Tax=Symmachiella macrocystis TaxID=2527985 RepID=A0A5C6AZT9_9PLAN|nr:hypothetical protein [Symmachiella macrocystis]TWU05168.1 hypothetical protein CA54_58560 [Symmachiella macrocystis]
MGDILKLIRIGQMFMEKDWSEAGTFKRGLIMGAVGVVLGLFLNLFTAMMGVRPAGGDFVTPTILISLILGVVLFACGLLTSPAEPTNKPTKDAQSMHAATTSDGQHDPTERSTSFILSHAVLPESAFHNPSGFLATMSEGNPDRVAILQRMWEHIAKQKTKGDPPSPPLFEVEPFLLCGLCGLQIKFPPPQQPGEAYMVAFVAKLREEDEPESTPIPCWYFTLEKPEEGDRPSSGHRFFNALRDDPQLINILAPDPAFRITFFSDMEKLLPVIQHNDHLTSLFAQAFAKKNYDELINDAEAFEEFLTAYESCLEPSVTTLGECRPGNLFGNHGAGPRIDPHAFRLDIAVELLRRIRRDQSVEL